MGDPLFGICLVHVPGVLQIKLNAAKNLGRRCWVYVITERKVPHAIFFDAARSDSLLSLYNSLQFLTLV